MLRARFIKIMALLLSVVVLAGCGASAADDSLSSYAPGDDRRLILYTSHKEEVWKPIVDEFERRTGIWVSVVTGGTNELLDRIAAESKSPAADVMFGGGVESLEACNNLFSPYLSSEIGAVLPQYRSSQNMWSPFSALPVVLIYNTKLVQSDQLKGWYSLYSDSFKGKIAFADPSVSGSGFTGLVTMLYAMGGEQSAQLRAFASALDNRVMQNSGDVLTAVADGSCRVGVTLEETALKRMAAGDDLNLVYPSDGTSCVPDGMALIKNAPHLDNAKLFVDFALSRDVQQLIVSTSYRRSVRSDLKPGGELIDFDSLVLVDYDVAWASRNREALLDEWAGCLRTEG